MECLILVVEFVLVNIGMLMPFASHCADIVMMTPSDRNRIFVHMRAHTGFLL